MDSAGATLFAGLGGTGCAGLLASSSVTATSDCQLSHAGRIYQGGRTSELSGRINAPQSAQTQIK